MLTRIYQSRLSPLSVEDHRPSSDCKAVHPRARRGGRHPPLLCGDSTNGPGAASASESRGWRWARGLLGAIRKLTPLEQAYFASLNLVPSLAAFMDASTNAVLQAREQAEVQKYAEIDCTPPWHHGNRGNQGDSRDWTGRSSPSSGSSNQGGTNDQDRPERFQTSPVTASSLPDVDRTMATLTGSRTRRDNVDGQIPTVNRFALLEADEDDDGDQNDEADPYDPTNETTRLCLQQPSLIELRFIKFSLASRSY